MTHEEWLRSWDWILINSSAGKDSQTALRAVHYICRKSGVEMNRLVVVHADLGRVEWPGTKELARKQAEHYGVRFMVTRRNGGDLLQYAESRGKWPSPQQRWCTSDFKRGPVRRVMTQLADETRRVKPGHRVRILNVMGMRAQESPARRKLQPLAPNESASNSRREVWDWLPIHSVTLEEVWEDIRQSGVPHHPAYDAGMPRLSCSFCIFAPPEALKLAGKLRPDLLDEYVRIEKAIGHGFKADLRLEDIRNAITSNVGCDGAVEDWSM